MAENDFLTRDKIGEEMNPGARIWLQYVETASKYDDRTVEGWNASTDVILIFAALFSAVLTAFLIESYKLLSPDPNDATLLVLQDISGTLKSMASGVHVAAPANTSISMNQLHFNPSSNALWVNGLWFTSLAFSLGVSSAAMLLKQWLHAYRSNLSGPPHVQARLRQRRYAALVAWQMPSLIASLPLLLSAALMEFLAGLILFLFSLNQLIASLVLCVIAMTAMIHLASLLLPALTDCPYKTAASPSLYRLMHPCRMLCKWTQEWAAPSVSGWGRMVPSFQTIQKYTVFLKDIMNISLVIIVVPLYLPGLFLTWCTKPVRRIIWRTLRPVWSQISYLRYYYWFPPPYLLWVLEIRPFIVSQLIFGPPSLVVKSVQVIYAAVARWRHSPSESEAELCATEAEGAALDAQAILWLMQTATQERIRDIAAKAVAGLSRNSVGAAILRQGGALSILRSAFQSCVRSEKVITPEDAELYARGLLSIHSSTRLSGAGADESSRVSDASLVRLLSTSHVREVRVTGIAAGLMVNEMVNTLGQHVDGKDVIPPFHLCLLVDTLGHEFASRKGWKADFWARTEHGWEGWARQIIPKLLTLLKASKSNPGEEPTPLDTAIAVTLSVFTRGFRIEDVQALEMEQTRKESFHALMLTALTPIVKYPIKFGCEGQASQDASTLLVRAACGLQSYFARCPEARLREILLDDSGVLSTLTQIVTDIQELDIRVQVLIIISELPSSIFPSGAGSMLVRLLSLPDASASLKSTILLCLQKMADSAEHAVDFVQLDNIPSLINLFDSNERLRPDVFRIIGSILYQVCGCQRPSLRDELLKKVVDQKVLDVVHGFFSSPFTLTLQEVQHWIFIMSTLCQRHKREVVASGALAAMAYSPQRHWRAAELFFGQQITLEALLSQVGLPAKCPSDATTFASAMSAAIGHTSKGTASKQLDENGGHYHDHELEQYATLPSFDNAAWDKLPTEK